MSTAVFTLYLLGVIDLCPDINYSHLWLLALDKFGPNSRMAPPMERTLENVSDVDWSRVPSKKHNICVWKHLMEEQGCRSNVQMQIHEMKWEQEDSIHFGQSLLLAGDSELPPFEIVVGFTGAE